MAAATAWVRSLSCKYSTAVADDAFSPLLPPPTKKHPPPTPAKDGSAAALLPLERDREDRETRRSWSMSGERERPSTARRKKKNNKDAMSELARKDKPRSPASLERPSSAFLEMTELPEGHPSRRVVELIFASGWADSDHKAPGEVQVEALFRVRSTARAVARFEAARAAARARGEAAGDARCGANGNEVMRFQCRRAAETGGSGSGSEVICAAVATCHKFGAARAVRTFAGSGAADAGAGGEGCDGGRRGVLVCRVIAGRVRRADTEHPADEHRGEDEYDSVDAGGGELVVLDRRAVLPCFLVVYNVVNPPKLLESSSSRRSR